MTTMFRAVYEGGILRPEKPLDLSEGETVDVIVSTGPVGPQVGDEEMVEKIKATQTLSELFELLDSLPEDERDYDIVKALEENRRWSGERSGPSSEGDAD